MSDTDGPFLSPISSLVRSDLFLTMITDDLIGINFSKDEIPYQMVGDRITVAIYGNTRIFVCSCLGNSGGIIAGRKGEEIVSFFL